MAGYETSSSAISYTLFELSLNQEIQNKLRCEINTVKKCEALTYETVHEMKYLNMVILGNANLTFCPLLNLLNF